MKLFVSFTNQTPIYEQLYTQLASQIVSGALGENECLPSIRFVSRELNISVIPVKTAYEMLESNGYIYTVPGKGCFVAQVKLTEKFRMASGKLQEAVAYCRQLGLTEQEIQQLVTDKLK